MQQWQPFSRPFSALELRISSRLVSHFLRTYGRALWLRRIVLIRGSQSFCDGRFSVVYFRHLPFSHVLLALCFGRKCQGKGRFFGGAATFPYYQPDIPKLAFTEYEFED